MTQDLEEGDWLRPFLSRLQCVPDYRGTSSRRTGLPVKGPAGLGVLRQLDVARDARSLHKGTPVRGQLHIVVAGGSPNAWATPPAAGSSRTLTVSGGFAVMDRQQRRLHQRARAHGYSGIDQYLAARCRQEASLPRMAHELGTTVPVIRRLLAEAGISRPPQAVLTARHRRRATDQRLAARAAQLGSATLERYLADRVVRRGWPLQRIADQLGVDVRTLRDRLRRLDLDRRQATIR